MQVSVTKESIRGVSSRLVGPKLFKIFEFHRQRADSGSLRTNSFLDRDPNSNIKSIRLWIESTLRRVSENEVFAKSKRGQEDQSSAYGNSGPSGVEKIVYDWGRLIGPPGKYERWSSSASSGSVDIRVRLGALAPYWEPHEFVVLTPLLLKYFRCRWRLADLVLVSFAYRNCKCLEFHRFRLKLCGGSSGCYKFK
ncbi:hypothetical protein PIB30_038321 [Stylosanthes scabra]|uniref:Uncharacterized protein n=1 Tax=Stylosanthes scabra TaxID=79078 RepID=A0ABU6UFQ4_9FABA|nr:hypothetical protein [Stylosanthes scabra]